MKNLLLLHGAIGSTDQLNPLIDILIKNTFVRAFDFSGHGASFTVPEQYSIPLFAEQVITCLDEQKIEQIPIFGYSMGGYVALYLARHYPHRVSKVITLATKFHWDEATAEQETKMLDPEKIEQKVPAFAATLKERHTADDWKAVLHKTAAMMRELGANNPLRDNDFRQITAPVMLLLGDNDKMVSREETEHVLKLLPHPAMQILPDTPHAIEQVNAAELAGIIRDFTMS